MKQTKHNPEEYTISVRKEMMEGMCLWVARVEEIPDILEFGDSMATAYENAISTLTVGQDMCLSQGTPFPAPKVFADSEASGRVTLRLKKTLHAQCIKLAEEEGVSLNSFISSCVQAHASLYGLSKLQEQVNDLTVMVKGIMHDNNNIQTTIYTQLAKQRSSLTVHSKMRLHPEDDSEIMGNIRSFCSRNVLRVVND